MGLDRLLAKSKKVTIQVDENESIELEIRPLTVRDLDLLVKLEKEDTKGAALSEMLVRTIQRASPDTPVNTIQNLPIMELMPVFDAIMEVNNMSEQKSSLIEEVKRRQNAARLVQGV